MKYDDEHLINMVRESSEEAKDLLYEKYRYIIELEVKKYIHLANILGYDYNDLYQDALVGFADALNSYREDKSSSLPSFISLCVSRKLQVSIKKANAAKNKMLNEAISYDYLYGSSQSPLRDMISDGSESDPLTNIIKDEKYNELQCNIKNILSDFEYEVYCLIVRGMKCGEIALLLNKSPKVISNTTHRLKNKIKTIINNE